MKFLRKSYSNIKTMKNSSLLAQVFNLYHISKLVQVFNLCLILFLSNPKKKFTNLLTILSLLLTYDLRLTTRYSRISTTHYRLPTIIFSILLFSTQLLSQRSLATLEDDMALVEGGSFIMGGVPGRDDKNGLTIYSEEIPPHEVRLSSFYISKYEVTQQLWQDVMGNNPSTYKNCGILCPVETVNWYECIEFCNRLSVIQGYIPVYTINKRLDPENQYYLDNFRWQIDCNINANGYRLPCEAEWEFVSRGGLFEDNYIFSGSDNLDNYSWNFGNSGASTHKVGLKSSNQLGLYDFSGNVYEFSFDYLAAFGDVVECLFGTEYVSIRGGAFFRNAQRLRNSERGTALKYVKYADTGFRVVKNKFK